MKLRSDFITNSSSTSFLVVWPRQIKDLQDVSEFISNPEYVRIIFNDSKEIDEISTSESRRALEFVGEQIRSGHIDPELFEEEKVDLFNLERQFAKREKVPTGFFFKSGMMELLWDEHDLKNKLRSFMIAQKFLEGKHGFIYQFTYGDEGSNVEASIESENPFKSLPSIAISHH